MTLFVMVVRAKLVTNSREQQEIVTLSQQLLQNCLILINTIPPVFVTLPNDQWAKKPF
jgi:hypothetical protein